MIRTVPTPSGPLKVPGVVRKLGTTPGRIDGGGPALGQHTDEVLAELGYDGARIAALRAARVI
jgi:crotonobetainyl-CoA:carnitine CoA-transferase CaiB-like acyl-CoA transferase